MLHHHGADLLTGFWINLPIGAMCVLLILIVQVPDKRLFPEIRTFKTVISKLDLPGFAIFVPCAVMCLLGLEFGGKDYPWDSATVASLFWGSGVVLVVFLWWERRVGDNAMLPLSVIRQRVVYTSCLTMLFLFTTIFTTSYYLPIYFQSIKGVSPLTSGVYMLPSILTQLVFAVVSGFLSKFNVRTRDKTRLLTACSPESRLLPADIVAQRGRVVYRQRTPLHILP